MAIFESIIGEVVNRGTIGKKETLQELRKLPYTYTSYLESQV